jgi:hypothetical protein
VKAHKSEPFGPTNFADRNRGSHIVPVAAKILATDGFFVDAEYVTSGSITNVVYAGDNPSDRTWGFEPLHEGALV